MIAMQFKSTRYFQALRTERDRAMIRDEWILRTMQFRDHEAIPTD